MLLVADGAAFHVVDIDSLGFKAFLHRDHVVFRLRGGVVAQLVVLVVGIRADEGDGHALRQGQDPVVLEKDDAFPGGLSRTALLTRPFSTDSWSCA